MLGIRVLWEVGEIKLGARGLDQPCQLLALRS